MNEEAGVGMETARHPTERGRAIPDHPLVEIRAGRRWAGFQLRELWAYRELLFFLTWRDVKVRYRQAALGAAWAVIQPVLTMLIFTIFFGRLAKMPSDGIPYSLFALAGLLPWTFFANALTSSGNSLVGSAHLITKIYFPRAIIPASAVLAGLLDLAIGFVVIVVFMAFRGIHATPRQFLVVLLVPLTTLLAISVGMILSALNVRYRDVRYALPFLVQVWMFATPVIYPASLVPEKWRWMLALNPMTGIIETFRASLFGLTVDWRPLAVTVAMVCALIPAAAYIFQRAEKSFADVV